MIKVARTAEILTIDLAGNSIKYWDFAAADPGGRPDILMIHGFRGDHHGLLRIVEALPEHRILVPDLPGFGQSEAMPGNTIEDYAEFIRGSLHELRLGPDTVLLGHSFGSIAAAHFAAAWPGMISELVLVNPICEPALRGPNRAASRAAELYYRAGARLPEKMGLALLRSPLIVRLMSMMMAKTRDPVLRRYIHGQHHSYFSSFASRKALLATFRTSIQHDVGQYARRLRMPVLLIVAEKDDIGSIPAQRRLAALIPDATLNIIGGVGHLIHYETPGTAASLIRAFLDERHP